MTADESPPPVPLNAGLDGLGRPTPPAADYAWDPDSDGASAFKAGFFGFAGSGKTITSFLTACVAREVLRLPGPIAMFDTERGSDYLKALCLSITGKPLLVKKARAFDDMLAWGYACQKRGVAVGIVDSITHPWRELCDAYLAQKNAALVKMRKSPRKRLGFEDWQVLKPAWSRWTDFYLNSPTSLVVCGRAGWEYEMSENDSGQKELNKTGVKMKTEGEFGFEPSLLVYMEGDQELIGGQPTIVRRATVIKDRFRVLDGAMRAFPSLHDLHKEYDAVADFFGPHIKMLSPQATASMDVSVHSSFDVDEAGDSAWYREKKARTIVKEEIEGELVSAFPGQSAEEKRIKADLLQEAFGTRSWTSIESIQSDQLRYGAIRLTEAITRVKSEQQKQAEIERAAAEAKGKKK